MRYLWIIPAFLLAAIGILIGRVFKLSHAVTVALAAVPMFLCLWKVFALKSRFLVWALAAVLGVAFAWVLMFAFR
jgi:hypothetical protein